MSDSQKPRVYSRLPEQVLALVDQFARLSGLTRSGAIAVLIVVGLRCVLGRSVPLDHQ